MKKKTRQKELIIYVLIIETFFVQEKLDFLINTFL